MGNFVCQNDVIMTSNDVDDVEKYVADVEKFFKFERLNLSQNYFFVILFILSYYVC